MSLSKPSGKPNEIALKLSKPILCLAQQGHLCGSYFEATEEIKITGNSKLLYAFKRLDRFSKNLNLHNDSSNETETKFKQIRL